MSRAIATALAAAALLAGCASLSPYPFQPGEPTAVVNLTDVPSPWFCVGGTNYKFVPDKQQRALVPVGKRIAVNSFVYLSGYQSYWTCTVGMSFVPGRRSPIPGQPGNARPGLPSRGLPRGRGQPHRSGPGTDVRPALLPALTEAVMAGLPP